MTEKNPINQRLKEAMALKNISQSDVARLLDMSPAGVNQMLKSKNNPDINHLLRITAEYGIDLNYILKGEGSKPKEELKGMASSESDSNANNRVKVGGASIGGVGPVADSGEVQYLRARVADLEKQLTEERARNNDLVMKIIELSIKK